MNRKSYIFYLYTLCKSIFSIGFCWSSTIFLPALLKNDNTLNIIDILGGMIGIALITTLLFFIPATITSFIRWLFPTKIFLGNTFTLILFYVYGYYLWVYDKYGMENFYFKVTMIISTLCVILLNEFFILKSKRRLS